MPSPPRRVLVAGTSGAGKTTLVRAVSELMRLPRVEIDSLHHGPQWTPRPEFADDVAAFAAGSSWVTEWQYAAVRPLLLARADTVVWLDHPKPVVMYRVTKRTVTRRLRHEVLWNGNTEGPLHTFFTDQDHIIRWAWRAHRDTGRRVREVLTGEHGDRVTVVRLRGQRQVDAWLAGPLARAAVHRLPDRQPLAETPVRGSDG